MSTTKTLADALYREEIARARAMNPCMCGFLGDPTHECRCTPQQISRYRDKLSGPLRDRTALAVAGWQARSRVEME